MDNTNTSEASDADDSGPESPVADLSAQEQGTNGNEPANQRQMNELAVGVPLEGVTNCEICRAEGINMGFLLLKDLAKHLREQHWQVSIYFRCNQCARVCPSLPSWYGHKNKCKGPIRIEPKRFRCERCDASFDTIIGRSQHERHEHPALRNSKREETLRKEGKPGRITYVWSEEETERLRHLDNRYQGIRHINKELLQFFPGKTAKQISDKRRLIAIENEVARRALNRRSSSESEDESVIEISDDESETSEQFESAEEGEAPDPIIEEQNRRWMEAMADAIRNIDIPDSEGIKEKGDELRVCWEGMQDSPDELGEALDTLVSELTLLLAPEENNENSQEEETGRANRQRNGQRTRAARRPANSNRRKRFAYARCQALYEKCPKKLAEMAVEGDFTALEMRQVPPSRTSIQQLYGALWSEIGPDQVQNERNPEPRDINGTFDPIKCDEVDDRIRNIKADSAPGPDKIKRAHLRRKGVAETLTMLYNILLRENHYPKTWKSNRTTLIPKSGKDTTDVKNWRPITMGSMMGRIFSSIIDQRLRKFVKQSPRQKGFNAEDGCSLNILLLNEAIATAKADNGGVVTVLDVAKAFDTVPHQIIKPGLARKAVPTRICDYIESMYKGCNTIINGSDGKVEIELRRGVKQGDPLSPLLFNLAMDKLIEEINEDTPGIKIGEENIAVLAFADDLVLLGRDKEAAQDQLRQVENYLTKLGMSLAAAKCSSFAINAKEKSWYVTDPELVVNEERVPGVTADESLKYLGVKIGPWRGMIKGTEVPTIMKTVKNVRGLKLKPYQKVDLLQNYILPRYLYALTNNRPAKGTLKMLDSMIRQELKDILHLVNSTANGFFYSKRSRGGLGFPKFERLVQLGTIRQHLRVQESNDAALRDVGRRGKLEEEARKSAICLGGRLPLNKIEYEKLKYESAKKDTREWAALESQGQGVKDFQNDEIGNSWLTNMKMLKGGRLIDAIRMRTNTFGTRVVLARTNRHQEVMCRKCGDNPETLGHILGQCLYTKDKRIRRHDSIKEFIAEKVGRRHTVFVEPTINENGELKKPDLVVKIGQKIVVADVTVRYENREYLADAAKEKEEKYKNTATTLARRIDGVTEGEVWPIVVGSRGAMPSKTKMLLKKMGMGKADQITVSMLALRSSIEIANAFLDNPNNRRGEG